MKPRAQSRKKGASAKPLLWFCRRVRFFTAAALLAVFPGAMQAQAATAAAGKAPAPAQSGTAHGDARPASPPAKTSKRPSRRAQRRALKLYLEGSKLFMSSRFEEAMRDYEQAARLDPDKADYRLAAQVARSHAVTALIQAATKDRLLGNAAEARAELSDARKLDPTNAEVAEHFDELGDDLLRSQPAPLYEDATNDLRGPVRLLYARGVRTFHLRNDQRLVIQQVFQAFGLDAGVDDSILSQPVRFDIGDANFAEATRALGMVTDSFYVPLDAHRVLVFRDTSQNRLKFTPQAMETAYLGGIDSSELHEVALLARTVFAAEHVATDQSSGTITLRAPALSLSAFNGTMRSLLGGTSQVLLDVRLIQLVNSNARNTGVQPTQTITAFNVYAEEQSLLNANQSLVQQIISSGLASPSDTLAILGILLASGQISSSLFSNGIALFGGGLTESALAPGAMSMNFSLNSSQSRELDQIEFRLSNGQAQTFRDGTKYPIQTASYSGVGSSIPGITGAGTSANLSSLLSSASAAEAAIPMIQYEDLGLTLKVTPYVMRSNRVAFKFDMKVDGLSGVFVDGNPVLNNQEYSGMVAAKQGQTIEIASEIDKSQSLALTGTPGIGEIPGLNGLEANNVQKNYATLVILLTPHILRGTQAPGCTPMFALEQSPQQGSSAPFVYATPKPTSPPPVQPHPVPARPVHPQFMGMP